MLQHTFHSEASLRLLEGIAGSLCMHIADRPLACIVTALSFSCSWRGSVHGAATSDDESVCHEQALQDFEEVISMEPKNYLGDDFSRITQIYRVAQYNLACCYSAIDQVSLDMHPVIPPSCVSCSVTTESSLVSLQAHVCLCYKSGAALVPHRATCPCQVSLAIHCSDTMYRSANQ